MSPCEKVLKIESMCAQDASDLFDDIYLITLHLFRMVLTVFIMCKQNGTENQTKCAL